MRKVVSCDDLVMMSQGIVLSRPHCIHLGRHLCLQAVFTQTVSPWNMHMVLVCFVLLSLYWWVWARFYNFSVLAMDLPQFCTKPLIFSFHDGFRSIYHSSGLLQYHWANHMIATTRTTRTPAFWGYPPPPHDYPHYWIPSQKNYRSRTEMLQSRHDFQSQGQMTLKI